ncbi:Bromodomain, putative [Angomonas deanei]|uniref:Bromodomain, putative n=1 Tax=Angomonas deanei TaxID=59799 RepID=A0A7G2CH90_9TRYP|nr:Bromodomain, putative [Angomonas deanei]
MDYEEAFDVCVVASIFYNRDVHHEEDGSNSINYAFLSSLLYNFFGLPYNDLDTLRELVGKHLKEKYNNDMSRLQREALQHKKELFRPTGSAEDFHQSRNTPMTAEPSSPLSPLAELSKTYSGNTNSNDAFPSTPPDSAIDKLFKGSTSGEGTEAHGIKSERLHSNNNNNNSHSNNEDDDEDEEERIANEKKEWGPWYDLLQGLSAEARARVHHYRSQTYLTRDTLNDLMRLIIAEPGSDIFLNPVPHNTMMEVHHERRGPYGDVIQQPTSLSSIKQQIARSSKHYYTPGTEAARSGKMILTLAQLEAALWRVAANCVMFNVPEGSYPSTARNFVRRAVYILVQYCREQLGL